MNFLEKILLPFCAILIFPGLLIGQTEERQDSERQVQVLPVFFVPKGQAKPTAKETALLQRHLKWSQRRYREMLNGESTFEIAGKRPEIYMARRPLEFYRQQPQEAAPDMADELLRWKKTDRFACNYIFLAVVMNSKDRFPKGGGRPFNGGVNTGGGIVKMSSRNLDESPNFQSTLQHELGHSFGLVHVDAYGYDMKRNKSIMAYNKQHHTKKFKPAKQPGELIPEDYRLLALNSLVLKDLEFNESKHLPSGYKLQDKIATLSPMEIPNHPDGIKVTTEDGETNRSSVQNVVHARIRTSIDRGEIEYDRKTMWHSEKLKTGWATITLEFPEKVTLDKVAVYSQHSGKAHAAVAAKLLTVDAKGKSELRSEIQMPEQDAVMELKPETSKVWQLQLKAGKSGRVVIRGLRFFHKGVELFPPRIPIEAEK